MMMTLHYDDDDDEHTHTPEQITQTRDHCICNGVDDERKTEENDTEP